ncbi:MAG: hypothetical protein F6J93_24845 [Oscillatoria sp. SIO1A7]|nr:hypothetical protein [Oscillatoria sp. SIO1A7]
MPKGNGVIKGKNAMSQDVSYWLDEVKSLKNQLALARQDLDAAYASSSRWRELYNKEAEQRRLQVKQLQEKIEQLEARVQERQYIDRSPEREENVFGTLEELEKLGVTQELKIKLEKAIRESDRAHEEIRQLREALAAERAARAETRKNLTAALADTVELLKKAGANQGMSKSRVSLPATPKAPEESERLLAESKNPLLRLPPLDRDRDPV